MGNAYSGTTVVNAGGLELNKTGGAVAMPGNLTLSGSTSWSVLLDADNQIATSSVVTWNSTGGWRELQLQDHNQQVAGISDSTGRGVIENKWDNTGTSQTSMLTVSNTTDCSYSGYLRDKSTGTGTGNLALTKSGAGKLTLSGSNITFTGPVNFNGGLINAAALNNLGNGTALNFNGGGLQFAGVYDPSTRTVTIQAGGATLDTQTNNITLNNAVACTSGGGLTKLGSGTLTLAAANNWTSAGNLYVQHGTLILNNASASYTVNRVTLSSPGSTLNMTGGTLTATPNGIVMGEWWQADPNGSGGGEMDVSGASKVTTPYVILGQDNYSPGTAPIPI